MSVTVSWIRPVVSATPCTNQRLTRVEHDPFGVGNSGDTCKTKSVRSRVYTPALIPRFGLGKVVLFDC